MRGNRHRQVRQRLKCGEIGPFQLSRRVSTFGSRKWVSAVARPWPGMCFRTGKTPPCASPRSRPGRSSRPWPAPSVGAVADHRIGARNRQVRQRQAVHCDAEVEQVGGDQAGTQARGLQAQAPDRGRTAGRTPRRAVKPANAVVPAAPPGRLPGRSGPGHPHRRGNAATP